MYTVSINGILRDDGTFIPADLGNSDYQVFLAWQNSGNVPALFDIFAANKPNEVATYKANRDSLISMLVGIAIAANAAGDVATFNGAITARQAVIDIINQPSVVNATTLQDLRSAIAAERLKVIQAMPASLKLLLNKLN